MPRITPKRSTLTVAVVYDDEPDLRAILRNVLEELGLSVVEVDEPGALEEAVSAYQPTIVISDGLEGGSGGTESGLSRLAALGRDRPLILVSGRLWALERTAEDLGVACVLPKPFDLDELEEAIRQCLRAVGIALPPAEVD